MTVDATRRVDQARLIAGWQPFCPTCRRPATSKPIGHVAAAMRLAHHLVNDHDPFQARLLEIALGYALATEPASAAPSFDVLADL